MSKLLPILCLILFLGESFAQQNTAIQNQINKTRDEVYEKLKINQISLEKAKKIYQNTQNQLLTKKDYANYIEFFMYEAVDFYVEKDDYKHASETIKKGIKSLNLVKGINYDTLFFKLNSELAEYCRRNPDLLNESQIYFKKGYDFLIEKPTIEEKLPVFTVSFLNNYGRLTDDFGDAEQSFNYYQKAYQIAKRYKIKLNLNAILSNIAKYYREKKDYETALKFYQEALENAETDFQKADKYLSIGRCYNQMKQFEKALKSLNQAGFFQKKSNELQPKFQINVLNNQADAYLGLNLSDKSEKTYSKSLNEFFLYFPHQKGSQIAHIYNGLSKVWQQKNENIKAINFAEKAIESSIQTPNSVIAPQEYFDALVQKANLISDPKQSVESYLSAINFSNQLRKSFDLPESKLFYSEKVYPIFEKTLNKIYENWQKDKSESWAEKLFYVLETSKSATLTDAIKEQKIRPKVLNDSLLSEEAMLRQKIVKLQVKLLETNDEKTLADLSSAKIALNHLIKKIESLSKNYFQLKYENRIISLKETQQKLSANSLFISYFWGENDLFYLASDKNGFKIIRLENADFLKENISKLYEKINSPPGIDAYKGHDLGKKCYDILLKPIEELLAKNQKLIISRHDILGFLPFEILEKKGKSDYLIFEKTIAYANSSTLHFDFDFQEKTNSNIIAYAPFSNGQKVGRFRDKGFKTLPASINEVGNINGEIYQDNQATKLNFNETYQEKGIIHFATHAQIDDEKPEKSFIALYPEGNDFKLYTPELYNLSLEKTQLVVLSACETGKGKIRKGEGIMSLARAFQFAGCPSVITTIWSAHDESMAKLSKNFYNYLNQEKPTDEALRLAKIDLIKSTTDHPFYWANFVLIGKSTTINFSNNYIWIWIVAFGVSLNFLAWKMKNRVRNFMKSSDYLFKILFRLAF